MTVKGKLLTRIDKNENIGAKEQQNKKLIDGALIAFKRDFNTLRMAKVPNIVEQYKK